MKRIWIWLLCIALAFSLTACNGCNDKTDPTTDPNASVGESSDPTDNGDSTNENGDTTTGDGAAEGSDSTTTGTANENDGTTDGKNDGTTGGKNTTTGKVTGGSRTEPTQNGTTKTQSGSTTAGTTTSANASGSTSTTRKTAGTAADNIVDWGDLFGTDPADPTDPTKSTATTTTTTTQPVTTTTVKPTEEAGVKFPAVGTDVDVKKQKGRYRISEIELDGDKLTITIKNDNKNWINQETDWVKFACYDKDGNELKGEGDDFGYLYIGALGIGKSFTQTVTLPAGTAEVKLVDSEIIYWTDWK